MFVFSVWLAACDQSTVHVSNHTGTQIPAGPKVSMAPPQTTDPVNRAPQRVNTGAVIVAVEELYLCRGYYLIAERERNPGADTGKCLHTASVCFDRQLSRDCTHRTWAWNVLGFKQARWADRQEVRK